MKTIRFFAFAAFAATMLGSCSNDDDQAQSNYPSDNIVRVTASVNNAKTRAEGAGTPLEEPFSLTIVNNSPENAAVGSKYTYVNKIFKKSGSEWSCDETLLWQNATTPVDIVAFAPATDDVTTFQNVYNGGLKPITYKVHSDQNTDNFANDLLYFYSPDFVPGSENGLVDKKLNMQFSHAFCQININVTLGTEFNKPNIPTITPITEAILGGTKITASVDVTKTDGIVTADADEGPTDIITTKGKFTAPEGVNAVERNCTSSFSCIAIPQDVAAKTFKVTLKTADKLYEWTSPDAVTLKSGYKYTLNLSMGNDMLLIKKESITATPWTDGFEGGNPGSLETE